MTSLEAQALVLTLEQTLSEMSEADQAQASDVAARTREIIRGGGLPAFVAVVLVGAEAAVRFTSKGD